MGRTALCIFQSENTDSISNFFLGLGVIQEYWMYFPFFSPPLGVIYPISGFLLIGMPQMVLQARRYYTFFTSTKTLRLCG